MNYHDLLSGRRRDPLAMFARCLLAGGEIPYRAVIAVRNRGFDTGRLETVHCGVPVISIGNLTTGGTGKTPLVRYVARKLRELEIRVALVSRGYGATNGAENDEARELAWALPDVPHLQDADRVESARIAVEELESQLILMDDGFQHRRLHRDLDIVVIDATCPFGYDHLLPRGLLREPIQSLRRADVAILSRCDAVPSEQRQAIHARVLAVAPELIWAESIHRPSGLLRWPNATGSLQSLRDEPVAVLSAIGNPAAFVHTVKGCGAQVVDVMSLPDHDPYDQHSISRIRDWISGMGGAISQIVCTHKDLVKLQTDRLGGKPLSALLIEIELLGGKQAVDRAITRVAINPASAS